MLAGRAPATGEGDGKPDGGGVKDEDLRPGAPMASLRMPSELTFETTGQDKI